MRLPIRRFDDPVVADLPIRAVFAVFTRFLNRRLRLILLNLRLRLSFQSLRLRLLRLRLIFLNLLLRPLRLRLRLSRALFPVVRAEDVSRARRRQRR